MAKKLIDFDKEPTSFKSLAERNSWILEQIGAPKTTLTETECEDIVKRICRGDKSASKELDASWIKKENKTDVL